MATAAPCPDPTMWLDLTWRIANKCTVHVWWCSFTMCSFTSWLCLPLSFKIFWSAQSVSWTKSHEMDSFEATTIVFFLLIIYGQCWNLYLRKEGAINTERREGELKYTERLKIVRIQSGPGLYPKALPPLGSEWVEDKLLPLPNYIG